jgi:hypothetical protein
MGKHQEVSPGARHRVHLFNRFVEAMEGNMSRIILQSASGDLTVPEAALREAGVEPGAPVAVVLTALPGPREIVGRASRFAARKLGDALGVTWPRWESGEWVVDIKDPEAVAVLGQLHLTADGEVIEERSATPETLRAAYDAQRSSVPAAT